MDGATANARRKYHHVHYGGKLTEHDIAGMVRGMENKDAEIARLKLEKAYAQDSLDAAKDEITRLTAALERTEANREAILTDLVEVTAERDSLRAENERLRGALRKLETGLDFIAADDTTEDARMAAQLLPIARAALAKGGE